MSYVIQTDNVPHKNIRHKLLLLLHSIKVYQLNTDLIVGEKVI